MRSLHLTLLAAACAAAFPVLAQTAGSGAAAAAPGAAGAGARGAPAASAPSTTVPSTTVPSTTLPSTTVPTFPSSTTNPSFGTSNPSFGTTNPTFGAAPTTGSGGVGDSSSSVSAQAQQRRQLALQQCQGVSDASRGACIQAADDDFARATGSDQLARGQPAPALAAGPGSATGAMAGNPRSTPDLSPSVRDNNTRGALTR